MWVAGILALGLVVGQAEGQPSKPDAAESNEQLAATVKRLVRQLDDETLAKRDAAEKELIALGVPALAHLPMITPRTPAEVKDRLGRVRRALESATAVSVTKAAEISLQGEMTLSAALEALEKQSGNSIVDFREEFGQETRDPRVTLDLNKSTFWEAFDTIADQAEITPYNFSAQQGKLAFVARSEEESKRAGRAKYLGLFRVEPLRVEATRDLRNARNNSFQVFLDFSWEPRLQPIVLSHVMSELKVLDENGKSLVEEEPQGEFEITPEIDSSSAELSVPLALPDRAVKKIASLKGKVELLVPGRIEAFEFGALDKAKASEQRKGNVTVFVDQVRKNQDVHEVRMRVKFDKAANALESHRTWIYNNPAYLVDPEGNQLESAGMEATLQEESEVGVAYQFVVDAGLKGYKFVYRTPSAIVKLPMEYEVTDIELP